MRYRGVDFILDDVLQPKIDGQMDLVTVARSALLPSVRHDLLPGPIVLDKTIAVLSVKVLLHRGFHTLDAVMIKIGKSDDMTKHGSIWVYARGVVLEINSTQVADAKFFTQRICSGCRHFSLDYDVTAFAV